jgi:hypothetical protein
VLDLDSAGSNRGGGSTCARLGLCWWQLEERLWGDTGLCGPCRRVPAIVHAIVPARRQPGLTGLPLQDMPIQCPLDKARIIFQVGHMTQHSHEKRDERGSEWTCRQSSVANALSHLLK